ncbi:hypothetical protein [Streptomyces sp. H39-C1]|uniref:hypothetical protein n=1 Tax=Streptomyces sp. H39-C1 TaxID=3004355 RepID=UPI0022B053F8|nr:hypothetical protein [Streptomyces sp. H39-C1]MCZ4101039.1 hypothetical protein [Streptomyces sp. H39-C1]
MTEQDRIYHGVQPVEDDDQQCRILVEKRKLGPTERQVDDLVLYELTPKDAEGLGGFEWGYSGSGPGRASDAILADALGLGDPWTSGFTGGPADPVLQALSVDFASDVMVQCCSQWRLSRPGVLRWCRGWYAQQGVNDLPAALVDLPELTSSSL